MALQVGSVGLMASTRQGAIDLAHQTEDAGYDALLWGDHLQVFPYSIWTPELTPMAAAVPDPNQLWDLVAFLSFVGAHTERLRVGASVTEAVRRHPATLAQEWLSIHHLTQGRAILGIGAGEAENLIPYGIPFERPISRMKEAIEIIRLLWETSGPVDFDGEFWKLEGAVLGLGAYEGTFPPIWTAGARPRGLKICGELADGWYPWGLTVADYQKSGDVIRAAAKDAGRTLDNFTWGQTFFVTVAEDRDVCDRILQTAFVKWFALVRGYELFEEFGLEHPLGATHRGTVDYLPSAHTREEMFAAIRAVPDEMVRRLLIHGTPDDIIAQLKEYEAVGLQHCGLVDVTAVGDPVLGAQNGPLFDAIIAGVT